MNGERAEYFLELYRRLEEALRQKGFQNGRSSVVLQFMSTKEGSRFKEILNPCREMRNILSHCPDIEGEPPLTPSEGAVTSLEKVVTYLEHPPLALNSAVKKPALITSDLDTSVYKLMKTMQTTGYSHIPVLENHKLIGVFSISTIFSHILDCRTIILDESTTLRVFSDYLDPEHHVCESFAFASPDTTMYQAELLLENKGGPKHKRPAALFITTDGTPNGNLLGMLTPWDLLGSDIKTADL